MQADLVMVDSLDHRINCVDDQFRVEAIGALCWHGEAAKLTSDASVR